MGPRARWETTPEAPGLQLAYTDQICSPLSLDHIPKDTFPIQQLHVSSCGISFATFASFEKISNIRTNAACLVILAGYVKAKVQHLGVEDSRIQYTTITVKDVIQGCEEMRAVTLVNLACDTDDFFSTPNIQPEVEVACIARVAMFAEIRQCDAASADWTAFGNTESFHSYVCQILERHSDLQGSVLYKIFQREGYLCRRLQVPEVHRDAIYSQSGLKSVQFRAVRKPDDPPEAGLEVLKVSTQEGLAETATWLQTVRGGLGCFKSQNALYFRVQDQFLKAARETIFVDDDRFSSFNINAKCVHQYKILGFPCGTSMKEVVKTLEAIEFVAVPSRIVNFRELAVVFLSAPSPPTTLRFQTSVGVIQIVELDKRVFNRKENSMVAPVAPSVKGQAKGRGKGSPSEPTTSLNLPRPAVPLLPNPYAGRVEKLEAQVETLIGDIEGLKQDSVDTKQKLTEISNNQNRGFKDLMDMISEMHAASASSNAAYAHSPPSKHQKI